MWSGKCFVSLTRIIVPLQTYLRQHCHHWLLTSFNLAHTRSYTSRRRIVIKETKAQGLYGRSPSKRTLLLCRVACTLLSAPKTEEHKRNEPKGGRGECLSIQGLELLDFSLLSCSSSVRGCGEGNQREISNPFSLDRTQNVKTKLGHDAF